MRRALAFILLISLCYYQIISLMIVEIGLVSHQRGDVFKEADGEIELSLTQKEFQEYRHGDGELYIKGQMFDIEKTYSSDKGVLVYCIDDKKETKFFGDLENFFNKNTSQDKSQTPNLLIKFLTLFYIPSFYKNDFKASENYSLCFRSPSLKIVSAFFPVSTPPPRG